MKGNILFRNLVSASVTATLVIGALLLLSLVSPKSAHGDVWSDDFNDNELSPNWHIYKLGSGALVSETLGRLEVVLKQEGTGNPFLGGIGARPSKYVTYSSEFTAEVAYALQRWPMPVNGVRVGLVANIMDRKGVVVKVFAIERINDPDYCSETDSDCDAYAIDVWDGVHPNVRKYVKTNNISGKLMIQRVLRNENVQMILSYAGPTGRYRQLFKELATDADMGRVRLTLQVWAHDWKYTGPAKVAFDNFSAISW